MRPPTTHGGVESNLSAFCGGDFGGTKNLNWNHACRSCLNNVKRLTPFSRYVSINDLQSVYAKYNYMSC